MNRALKQISDYARNLNAGEGVGLYSTVLSRADYNSLSGNTGEMLAASVTPDYKPSR